MKNFFKNKTAVVISIIVIVLIAAAVFFVQKGIRKCGDNPSASQSESNDKNGAKTDGAEKDKNADENSGAPNGAQSANTPESPLKEGENLEKMVDDFNTLPEGEEKEKLRKRLEEILAEAEKQAPANSAGQED